jgi:hypothetical protein
VLPAYQFLGLQDSLAYLERMDGQQVKVKKVTLVNQVLQETVPMELEASQV